MALTQIKAAAQDIYEAVQASGTPQVALPALAFATANLLCSITPIKPDAESPRDIFVRQLDQHLKLIAEGKMSQ